MMPSDDITVIREDLLGLVERLCDSIAEDDYQVACLIAIKLNHASVLLMNTIHALHLRASAMENAIQTNVENEETLTDIQEIINRICRGKES